MSLIPSKLHFLAPARVAPTKVKVSLKTFSPLTKSRESPASAEKEIPDCKVALQNQLGESPLLQTFQYSFRVPTAYLLRPLAKWKKKWLYFFLSPPLSARAQHVRLHRGPGGRPLLSPLSLRHREINADSTAFSLQDSFSSTEGGTQSRNHSCSPLFFSSPSLWHQLPTKGKERESNDEAPIASKKCMLLLAADVTVVGHPAGVRGHGPSDDGGGEDPTNYWCWKVIYRGVAR